MKQQKKTSAASTSMSTVKKNVIRSPIKSRSTVTPLGGSIQSLETAVTDIVISYVTKGDGREAAYIKPLIDAWRSEDHDKCTESWYIDSVVPRRDGDTNEPMTASSTLPYPWECIVTLRGSYQETPTEIGHKLAASFSGFTTPNFRQRHFQFKCDASTSPPSSLNKYLLDSDCITYLKKIYFGVSKESLMEDEEVLTEFFGTPEEGVRVLSNINDVEWEKTTWN
jgi:hypothetical protein